AEARRARAAGARGGRGGGGGGGGGGGPGAAEPVRHRQRAAAAAAGRAAPRLPPHLRVAPAGPHPRRDRAAPRHERQESPTPDPIVARARRPTMMTHTTPEESARDAAAASAEAEVIKAGGAAGAPPDARAALESHPNFGRHKSVALDLAYEEFCLRREAGEAVDPDEFCERFPAYRSSLRQVIWADRLMSALADRIPEESLVWPEPGTTLG